ncbi:MAG: bifunctional diaminohydroxyphosphoribosylaminopyrimidine deaminase/5-amino-6-(5-phosphoribosylamino)uracil reductase RibD [Odoribacter sp.]
MKDIEYMNRAILLAEKGRGGVNPNPLVGALIVKEERIIGEGWHERYGGLHAERNAFENCQEDPTGATMYVTLEPCCHYGKTPPGTDVIIEHRIARGVLGITDPNPVVAGRGIECLKRAGIEVKVGVGEKDIRMQNRIFLKYITTKRPWVMMKTAMTLDGKIATTTGDSKWVTGVKARHIVHELRASCMSVMVGIGTVEADNPQLNCRIKECLRQPYRIVVDSHARLSLRTKLLSTAYDSKILLAYTKKENAFLFEVLEGCGVKSIRCKERDGRVDIDDLLEQLGKMKIDSVLLEGGGTLNATFLEGGFVDEVYAFIAPKLVGGKEAKTPVEGKGIEKMKEAIVLQEVETIMVGKDILVHGFIR